MFYVYVYLDPRKPGGKYDDLHFTAEPIYVGKGKNNRYKDHLRNARKGVDSYLCNKLRKIISCGLEPIVIKLYEGLDENVALKLEVETIAKIGHKNIGPLANITSGGESQNGHYNSFFGHKHTELTKMRMRLGGVGNRSKRTISEETKNKISQANKGRTRSADAIQKYKKAKLGTTHTQETKDKISEALAGRIFTDEHIRKLKLKAHKRKIIQMDLNDMVIMTFDSVKEAALRTGVPRTSITACCRKRLKHAGNFKWVYEHKEP